MRYKPGDIVFFKYPGVRAWDWGVIITIENMDNIEVYPFPLFNSDPEQLQELAFTGELAIPFSPIYISRSDIVDNKTFALADKVERIRDDFAQAFAMYQARMLSIEKHGRDLW